MCSALVFIAMVLFLFTSKLGISFKTFFLRNQVLRFNTAKHSSPSSTAGNAVEKGHVYFVATPLGNLGDMTLRAIDILSKVDVICSEDTRVTKKLLSLLNIELKSHQRVISHHEHNWREQIPKLIKSVKEDQCSIAVVTDAGTPGISDPGAEFADALHRERLPIHPIPGPSAAIAAISISGFYQTNDFSFYGFLPVKGAERAKKLRNIVTNEGVVVLYEAPHRIVDTMQNLQDICGDLRSCVVCRELTKKHEEIFKGSLKECMERINNNRSNINDNGFNSLKGEFTIVIGPLSATTILENDNDINTNEDMKEKKILEILINLKNDNLPRSTAVKMVVDMMESDKIKVNKSKVYKIALDKITDWK